MNNFFVVKNHTPVQVIETTGKTTNIDIDITNASCLSNDGIWTIIGCDDSIIKVIRNFQSISTIRLYRESVISCAVNQKFNLIACGTGDGILVLCTASTSSILKIINLDPKSTTKIIAEKILISPTWGFIVAYCSEISKGTVKYFISVYSLNGLFISKTKLQSSISNWYSWTSSKGFDYLAWSTENGIIYSAEIFYLKQSKFIYNCRSKVISINYSNKSSTLLIVTKNCEAVFIPYEITIDV